jgi:hypothetical protein
MYSTDYSVKWRAKFIRIYAFMIRIARNVNRTRAAEYYTTGYIRLRLRQVTVWVRTRSRAYLHVGWPAAARVTRGGAGAS